METENITIQFEREKETKNAVRFQEKVVPGRPPIIGTLYVQKWAVPADATGIAINMEVPKRS